MTKRQILLILSLNLVLSMVVVAFFPRFDWLTVALFFMINAGLYFAIDRFQGKASMEMEEKIDGMIDLLHKTDPQSRVDEAEEDDFSKLRDEIVKMTSENKRIAQEAEDRRVQLTEYTEDIAHQIKTPITGALLMLDLIDDASDKEALKRMGRSMERLLGLSDALLKLAAVDSDVVAMKKKRSTAWSWRQPWRKDWKVPSGEKRSLVLFMANQWLSIVIRNGPTKPCLIWRRTAWKRPKKEASP